MSVSAFSKDVSLNLNLRTANRTDFTTTVIAENVILLGSADTATVPTSSEMPPQVMCQEGSAGNLRSGKVRCPIIYEKSGSSATSDEVPGHLRTIGSKIRREEKDRKAEREVGDVVGIKEPLNSPKINRLRKKDITEIGGLGIVSNTSTVISASSLRSSSSTSSVPTMGFFSEHFMYWAVVMAAVMIAFFVRRLIRSIMVGGVEQKLAVAVTKEMRYKNYEIVSPDTNNAENSTTTRRRTRSISEKKKNPSSSTNTFLLFSPVKSPGDE